MRPKDTGSQAPGKHTRGACLRLEPQRRLAPWFDEVSVATFPVAAPHEMGVRVVDDCCQEHIQ